MANRTARASGTVRNVGNTQQTLDIYLLFDLTTGGKTRVTLAPGASQFMDLSPVSLFVSEGQTVLANVIMNRVSPDPLGNVYIGPSSSFTEPIIPTYDVTWTPDSTSIGSISEPQIGYGEGIVGEFQMSIGEGGVAQQGWFLWALGGLALFVWKPWKRIRSRR